jgi:hypothetical protein
MIVSFKAELKSDPILGDYFSYLRKGFVKLSNLSKINLEDIVILIKYRCKEMYCLNAFMVSLN